MAILNCSGSNPWPKCSLSALFRLVRCLGKPKNAFKVFRFPTCLEPMSLWGIKPGSLWLAVNH